MCKHPLKGFKIGYNPKTGKDIYKITSYKVDHIEEQRNGTWTVSFSPFVDPAAVDYENEFIEIPCNRCIDCRLKYSREWANRCMMELAYYEPCECWFVTLTYDDEHLPRKSISKKTGEIFEPKIFQGTLLPEDLQKFWKKLRRYMEYHDLPSNIRYYACGEYGSKTFRPHYHAILYGCPCIDIVPWEMSKSGNRLFRSPLLEQIWGKGFVVVSPVSWDTCAYVARYTMKKAEGIKPDDYEDDHVNKEFVRMSRRPGIGRDYYEEHKDHIYEFDQIVLKNSKGGFKVKPPRYYDSLFEVDNPDAYKEIKEKRKECAEISRMMIMSQTDKDYLDVLIDEEKQIINRLKGLYRDKI